MGLDTQDHETLALWAADCAEHVLSYLGSGNESCVKQPFAKTKGYRHTLPLPLFDTASASVL